MPGCILVDPATFDIRHRFSPEIISHAVWLYHKYCLSFRDVEDLLAERGIIVSYETIRQWCAKFGPEYARRLKRRQGRLGDTWFLDEVFHHDERSTPAFVACGRPGRRPDRPPRPTPPGRACGAEILSETLKALFMTVWRPSTRSAENSCGIRQG